ncbi:MAG TPA: lactate racemase domain-containing protein [Anaerolineales bacterium]|nr:lactate racemase domain-containing protein [Anaerolineales bacterium]
MDGIVSQAIAAEGKLSVEKVGEAIHQGLRGKFSNQKILVLIPDHTRSLPLPMLFRIVVDVLSDAKQLDFMVALGTHPALTKSQLLSLVGITGEEQRTKFAHVGLLNHAWDTTSALKQIGVLPKDQIREIAGAQWHPSMGGDVPVKINAQIFNYDQIIIVGPTFPHEVVGFSGGAKYLFPGISGPEMINSTHWLGALGGVMGTIGIKDTPIRRMIHAAAKMVKVPVTLIGMVVQGHEDLAGIFIGDYQTAWEAAADLSSQIHIQLCEKPYQRVLSKAPVMYDELWTAAKAMYKLESVVADGGDLVIYAPHLDTISDVHGKYIYEMGYHTLPYFLAQWDKFKHVPLGVLAHSTHVRGAGVFENGHEHARITVTLSSQISEADCKQINLGYLNPDEIDPAEWKMEGSLYVPNAGELLYKLKGQG